MWSLRKKAFALSSGAMLSGATYVASDEQRRRKAELTLASSYRVLNLVSTVATICGDYGIDMMYHSKTKSSLYDEKHKELQQLQTDLEGYHEQQLELELHNKAHNIVALDPWMEKINENKVVMEKIASELVELSEEKDLLNHNLHLRNAKRLTKMCADNGGLYIKVGQHIAMLDYIVPLEYQNELFSLLGTTPQSSFEAVRRVIKTELGAYPEEIFDTFESVPIASASLAQVHIATKNNQKYAVKVQHEGLAESAYVDMLVITKLVSCIPLVFKEFNYDWLSAEMNRNVPLELDFKIERENILKTTHMLREFIRTG